MRAPRAREDVEGGGARGRPRRARPDRLDRNWMLAAFGLALLLRVAWVLAAQRKGLAFNDTFFYHQAADGLADGRGYQWLDEPTSRWPPVYPGLLAVVYAIFGTDARHGELLNALIGAAAVPLVYLCGLRLLGRQGARLASALLAVFPGQILFAEALLAGTLYTTLLLAVLALCLWLPRDRWWAALAVGVAIGVATETRGEGLMLLILPLAIWWRPPARQLALVAVGVALVVTPWIVRNAVEMDALVPVSTNGSQTFWAGHNPDAYGGPTYDESAFRRDQPGFSAQRQELEDARRWRREAVDWMLGHPLQEALLVPRKLLWLIRGDSAIVGVWIQPGSADRPSTLGGSTAAMLGNVADLFFYGLLAFTLLAALVAWRSRPLAREVRALWLLLGAALVLYGFVLYGNFRYRVPLEPVMILLVAPLLARTILPRQWTSAPSPSA